MWLEEAKAVGDRAIKRGRETTCADQPSSQEEKDLTHLILQRAPELCSSADSNL